MGNAEGDSGNATGPAEAIVELENVVSRCRGGVS